MRIIAGIAKGRRLAGPKSDQIRPALDKVKEAVFNILGPFTGEEKVLDLFAGTGSIGLEALSRGAQSVVFVDFGVEALQLIRKNIELCRFGDQSTIVRLKIPEQLVKLNKAMHGRVAPQGVMASPKGVAISRSFPGDCFADARNDITKYQEPSSNFDLIFVDPPYDRDLVNPTLESIATQKILAPSGRVVVEHSPREKIAEDVVLKLVSQRKYGQTLISFLENF